MKNYRVTVIEEVRLKVVHIVEAENEEDAKQQVYEIPSNEGDVTWEDQTYFEVKDIEEVEL